MTDDLFAGGAASVRAMPQPAKPVPSTAPLAARLRPARLEDVVGQDEALGERGALGRMVRAKRLRSLLLWGPPGCGKTTLARLLVDRLGGHLVFLSAVTAGVADLRATFADSDKLRRSGRQPVLFIDEIHRFNRAQQDGLLARVEDGSIVLIGATTENPSFAINAALLSRLETVVLEALSTSALGQLLERAEADLATALPLKSDARDALIRAADGDGRALFNMIESVVDLAADAPLDAAALAERLSKRPLRYDRGQDQHYNLISAFHKAVRGSDPDAALYWLARMLKAGEDPLYVARRLVRMASEDIGLADPTALAAAEAAAAAFARLGSPEGELALAQVTVHLAAAPKSVAVYNAWKSAEAAAESTGSLPPRPWSVNAPTALMRELGYGEGYLYDHDQPGAFAGQNHFPEALERQRFYAPSDRGGEAAIKHHLEGLVGRRAALGNDE